MEEQITIHEARTVLQKLVRERKALEKGLAAADQLSDIEVNISSKQAVLDAVSASLAQKQAEWSELDEQMENLKAKTDERCRQREHDSARVVEEAMHKVDELAARKKSIEVEHQNRSEELAIKLDEEVAGYKETIKHLQSKIAELKSELGTLQAQARRLVNI